MPKFKLTEDWLATLTGWVIVLVIGAGLIGPGPQKANLSADAGEITTRSAMAVGGWSISATLDGTAITADTAFDSLEDGGIYAYTCANGSLTAQQLTALPEGIDAALPEDGDALLILDNGCEGALALNYSISVFVRWPLFGLFS